jgi:hypothetical protein
MEPILEIRGNRWSYAIVVFFCLLLNLVFVYAILYGFQFWAEPYEQPQPIELTPIIMGGLFLLLGLILLYYFAKLLITNPALFNIFSQGFESISNGVSTGVIPWNAIAAMEETVVTSSGGDGARRERVLAIHLNDMSVMTDQLPGCFRFAYRLAGSTGRYRTANTPKNQPKAVPIMLSIGMFGRRYEEVLALMQQLSGVNVQRVFNQA